jgi:hypothetical protein
LNWIADEERLDLGSPVGIYYDLWGVQLPIILQQLCSQVAGEVHIGWRRRQRRRRGKRKRQWTKF